MNGMNEINEYFESTYRKFIKNEKERKPKRKGLSPWIAFSLLLPIGIASYLTAYLKKDIPVRYDDGVRCIVKFGCSEEERKLIEDAYGNISKKILAREKEAAKDPNHVLHYYFYGKEVPQKTPRIPRMIRSQKIDVSGIDNFFHIYKKADKMYGIPWQILAAIHTVETNRSGDSWIRSNEGAIGPMQFMPETWKVYGVDADKDGKPRICDVEDSIYSAAKFLNEHDAKENMKSALWHYNHSWDYVSKVLRIARRLGYRK